MSYRQKLINELCNADHRSTDRELRSLADMMTIEQVEILNPERECTVKAAVRKSQIVPADWPTEAEIEAICAPSKYDFMAKQVRSLIDDEDWLVYTMVAELAARQEERRAP